VRPANGSTRISEFTFLLPWLDQKILYEEYDQSQQWYWGGASGTAGNLIVSQKSIPTFLCPSSTDPTRQDGNPDVSPWAPNVVAVSDYGSTIAVDKALETYGLVKKAGPGILDRNTTPRLSDVTDGLSNTILFAESAGRPSQWTRGKLTQDASLSLPANNSGNAQLPHVNGGGWSRPASELIIRGATFDGSQIGAKAGSDVLYAVNRVNGALVTDSVVNNKGTDATYGSDPTGEVYSFHPGGANVALGDGSVRFINEKIPISVFAAYVTRSGGEDEQFDSYQ
jgi:prepilin-type processing-associated H-X9-DG protein